MSYDEVNKSDAVVVVGFDVENKLGAELDIGDVEETIALFSVADVSFDWHFNSFIKNIIKT